MSTPEIEPTPSPAFPECVFEDTCAIIVGRSDQVWPLNRQLRLCSPEISTHRQNYSVKCIYDSRTRDTPQSLPSIALGECRRGSISSETSVSVYEISRDGVHHRLDVGGHVGNIVVHGLGSRGSSPPRILSGDENSRLVLWNSESGEGDELPEIVESFTVLPSPPLKTYDILELRSSQLYVVGGLAFLGLYDVEKLHLNWSVGTDFKRNVVGLCQGLHDQAFFSCEQNGGITMWDLRMKISRTIEIPNDLLPYDMAYCSRTNTVLAGCERYVVGCDVRKLVGSQSVQYSRVHVADGIVMDIQQFDEGHFLAVADCETSNVCMFKSGSPDLKVLCRTSLGGGGCLSCCIISPPGRRSSIEPLPHVMSDEEKRFADMLEAKDRELRQLRSENERFAAERACEIARLQQSEAKAVAAIRQLDSNLLEIFQPDRSIEEPRVAVFDAHDGPHVLNEIVRTEIRFNDLLFVFDSRDDVGRRYELEVGLVAAVIELELQPMIGWTVFEIQTARDVEVGTIQFAVADDDYRLFVECIATLFPEADVSSGSSTEVNSGSLVESQDRGSGSVTDHQSSDSASEEEGEESIKEASSSVVHEEQDTVSTSLVSSLKDRIVTLCSELHNSQKTSLRAKDAEISSLQEELSDLASKSVQTRIEEVLAHMAAKERFRLDLSRAFAERGFLGYEDRLWDERTRTGRMLRIRFDVFRQKLVGVGSVSDEIGGIPTPSGDHFDAVVVDLTLDAELRKLLSHFQEELELPVRFLDLYEDWCEHCSERSDLRTISLVRERMDSMIQLVRSTVVLIWDSFGGIWNDDREKSRTDGGGGVLLGSLLGCGRPRHRSLCLKLVFDACSIPCRLESGRFRGEHFRLWNVVRVGDRKILVDMAAPELIVENGTEDYVATSNAHLDESRSRFDVGSFGRAYSSTSVSSFLRIGRGTFADVYAIQGSSLSVEFEEEYLAVKEIDLTDVSVRLNLDYRSYVMREARLLQTLDHPNVLKLLGTFSFRREVHVVGGFGSESIPGSATHHLVMCLLMKKYDGSAAQLLTIFQRLKHAEPIRILAETLLLLLHVVNGLRYLHSLSLVHLDLKPANVLVNWDPDKKELTEVVLCDFSGAKEMTDTFLQTTVMHTQDYSAPEVRRKEKFDARADIYSFGCLLLAFSEFFGRFSELQPLGVRCKSKNPLLRPSLLEISYVLKEYLFVLNEELKSGS